MDRFDDIWKNRFNDGNAPIGDWNTPDDDLVWEGIAPHIPQQDDRRKYIWLWWSIGLLMLALLSWVTIKNGLAIVSTDVENIEKAVSIEATNLIANDLDKKIVARPTDNNSTNIEKQVATNERTILRTDANNTETTNQPIFEKKKAIILSTQKNNPIQRNHQVPILNRNIDNTDISTKIIEIKKQRTLNNLNTIPLLDLENLAQKNTLNSTINCLTPNEDGDSKSKIALSINAGAVYWQHQISDQYTNDLSPFDFNYDDNWGWKIGLMATFDLNNYITPYVKIQKETVKVTSGHNSELNYNTANEQGTNANTYLQNLATPYGLSEATFRLDRDEGLTDEMVDLTVNFASTHQIENWSVPFGLKFFPFGKKQRFQWNTSVGMGINYLSNIQNTLKNVDTHHDFIHYSVDSPTIFNNSTIEKWHYDVRLGTGVDYFINDDLKFNFQYNWSRGLNPVFQQGDYATRINRHQLSIGVTKTLNLK
jgi:opacity protein-like surface antigen